MNEAEQERAFRLAGYQERYDYYRAEYGCRPTVPDAPAEPEIVDLPVFVRESEEP
jgi:hypothetical protein